MLLKSKRLPVSLINFIVFSVNIEIVSLDVDIGMFHHYTSVAFNMH